MIKLSVEEHVLKFLGRIDRKRAGQLALKMLSLTANLSLQDAEALRGSRSNCLRADVGDYRIIYRLHGDVIQVVLIGRRNDDDVYKEMKRRGL